MTRLVYTLTDTHHERPIHACNGHMSGGGFFQAGNTHMCSLPEYSGWPENEQENNHHLKILKLLYFKF